MSDERLSRALHILDRLIAFDTVSARSNLELIDYVEGYLDEFGISSRRFYDDSGEKANLWATIGSSDYGGVIWSGHTDVVPVANQDWATDPFKMQRTEERVIGRGVTDMKGFLACCLALVPEMVQSPKQKIHLCFSYDEEVGCLGVRSVVKEIASWSQRPLGCIVGEPSSMKVITGHKTKRSLRCHVRGRSAHSSLAPQAINAVHYGADLVQYISEMGKGFALHGPMDDLFSVPHTTAHVGVMQGGTQLNIVPDRCHFDFEFRALPDSDADALVAKVKAFAAERLEPQMKKIEPNAGFEFETLASFPGLAIDAEDDWVRTMQHCAQTNYVSKVAYGAEAGLFNSVAGVPTVICGPGDISDAHTANESLEISQLSKCMKVLMNSFEITYA